MFSYEYKWGLILEKDSRILEFGASRLSFLYYLVNRYNKHD